MGQRPTSLHSTRQKGNVKPEMKDELPIHDFFPAQIRESYDRAMIG